MAFFLCGYFSFSVSCAPSPFVSSTLVSWSLELITFVLCTCTFPLSDLTQAPDICAVVRFTSPLISMLKHQCAILQFAFQPVLSLRCLFVYIDSSLFDYEIQTMKVLQLIYSSINISYFFFCLQSFFLMCSQLTNNQLTIT